MDFMIFSYPAYMMFKLLDYTTDLGAQKDKHTNSS